MKDNDKTAATAQSEDLELALRSKEGDRAAFSALVSKYHRSLRNYVRTFCSNKDDAEDICQESYRKAYLSIASFNPEYPFRIWLFSIAKNTAIDHIRRKNNFSTVNIADTDDTLSDNTITEDSPEESLIDEQAYKQFVKAIEELPEKYRKVAELRLIHNYAYEEIAKTLDMPLNTVRTRLRRAKIRIGELIKD